ncbi:sigma-70 family RNA polymerase sigma factor [Flagellimonas taeanensis]|uniref:sigma-70 family RNA polymerase sigma factor n=1 Tax=Flavobacteriaceae TaxID=49546 RepID=UPI000E68F6A0|nr:MULTISPECIES: sigma-70 family RNA polymerase sigma factor [Allomuricauda]MDC6386592.1 sigma-70 family RNA polymerase sigma factor [Muricauda sp. SK9]RIV51309.1 sigma-70 family RNA polymerase sigma factor [Allomuricauda taeanensis]
MKTSSLSPSSSRKENQDLRLFAQLEEGKYEALMLLHQKFYRPLCRFGAMFEQNTLIIEEKVADVFIELWTRRDALSEVKYPKAYLYIMARNKLLRTAKGESLLTQIHDHLNYSNAEQPSHEEELIHQEEKQINQKRIEDILQKVPERSRRVFEMSRIEGFKYREIAEILGISYRTVEQHVAITIRTIKNNLTDH